MQKYRWRNSDGIMPTSYWYWFLLDSPETKQGILIFISKLMHIFHVELFLSRFSWSQDSNRMERSYIMIKPDGVQRGVIGRIISRFEDKGFKLVGLKMVMAEDDILEEHYAELKVHYRHMPSNLVLANWSHYIIK